jgi:hypothetical protein
VSPHDDLDLWLEWWKQDQTLGLYDWWLWFVDVS